MNENYARRRAARSTRRPKMLLRYSVILLLATALALIALPRLNRQPVAGAAQAPSAAAQRAVEWLVAEHQNDDGGFTSYSAGKNQAASDASGSADAMLAMASVGWYPAGPLRYFGANPTAAATYAASSGGAAGKVVMAVVAAGQDPENFVGADLVAALQGHYNAGTGQYDVTAYTQALAILGLVAAGQTPEAGAIQWLRDQQDAQGWWDNGYGTGCSRDDTAMAVMALVAAGVEASDPALAQARQFFSDTQESSGAWKDADEVWSGENANSTALALQALAALGESYASCPGDWCQGGAHTPLSALLTFQSADTGAFWTSWSGDNFYATVQAVPAVLGRPYPLEPIRILFLPTVFNR